MGWASRYIKKLLARESVSFRPHGHSMTGRIESGQLCTVVPIDPAAANHTPAARAVPFRRDSTEKGVSGMRSNSKATPLAKFLSSIALGLSMMTHAIAD
jgi:hypothetical protein